MALIERIQCGNGNCYVISEENNAILVDTSRTQYRDIILEKCRDKKINLIVLTHGHIDHIQNAAYLADALNAPIAMHKADYELAKNNMLEPLSAHSILGKFVLALSMRSFQKDEVPSFEPTVYICDGHSLENYGIHATVIELPGHTKGSIGIKVGDSAIIVGDALMNIFYPSKSMLYGDRDVMEISAKKISNFENTTIYFGHGKPISNRPW